MNKIKVIIGIGLLIALTVVFINCKKEKIVQTPATWKYSVFTDARDGKTYKYIKIGNQEWMAENLAYQTESGSWNFANEDANGDRLGRLYTLDAAMDATPAGWHLPTDAEWKQLEMVLGMNQYDADLTGMRGAKAGDKLKAETGWPEVGMGTNEVGFAALPGGFRSNPGIFVELSDFGLWWCAPSNGNSQECFRIIASTSSKIGRGFGFNGDGYSVRCVKDLPVPPEE